MSAENVLIRRSMAKHIKTDFNKHIEALFSNLDNHIEPNEFKEYAIAKRSQFKKIPLNKLIIIFPHNTPTVKSKIVKVANLGLRSLLGAKQQERVSRNQYLSLDEYLNFAPLFSIIGVDIDIARWSHYYGTGVRPASSVAKNFTSLHGTDKMGYAVTQWNASPAETADLFVKVFACADKNPSTIFIIRSENYIGGKEMIELFNAITDEYKGSFVKPHASEYFYEMTSGVMPTYGEVIQTGKNIILFMEKNKDSEFDPNTGIYNEGLIMSQNKFIARTKWNDVPCLINESKPVKECLLVDNFKYLPPINFFTMIDLYQTSIGARYDNIDALHSHVFSAYDTINKKIQAYLTSIKKTPPSGYMMMVDMITPEIIYTHAALNIAIGIFNNDEIDAIASLIFKKALKPILFAARALRETQLSVTPQINSIKGLALRAADVPVRTE